jgi:exodeoxyribonuclease VII large subunit
MSSWGRERVGEATRVWGVGALVQAIGDSLAARFAGCVVRGEVSGFSRAASGHGYFTLKDEHGQAALRCAMFRRALSQVEFPLGDGMLIEARGNLAVYEARGELQLIVEGVRQAGAGALYEQFLRLKARLEAEGLFDPATKRPIAAYPRRVAVVTSRAAAALQDVLTALARRAPHVEVVVVPAGVQGPEAPAQLVRALVEVSLLHRAGTHLDAVIVCRGGGSLEDLWAFNDERVVRAIAGCVVPVISGVGHETDVTLSDFVADLRAPTPTAAAEMVAQDRQASLAELAACERRMQHRMHHRLDSQSQRLDQAAMRLARPAQALGRQRQQLDLLHHRMGAACQDRVRWAAQRLPALHERMARASAALLMRQRDALAAREGQLEALSPSRVLERGYAWLSDSQGHALTQIGQAQVGDEVSGVLVDGVLRMRITERVKAGQS